MAKKSGITGSKTENRGDASHRIPRVEREIREFIGSYLIGGFKGELPGFISVSRVILSKDFRQAKVLITAHTPDDQREPGFEKTLTRTLADQAYDIQHALNAALRMKNTPRLMFVYDTGAENSLKVDNILHRLAAEREQREASEKKAQGLELVADTDTPDDSSEKSSEK